MPTRQTLTHVDAYWAENLGCAPEDLHRPGVTLLGNGGGLATYQGAYLLRWEETCVVTVPVSLLPLVEGAVRGQTPDEIFDRTFLTTMFGSRLDRIIGPAFQGCADTSDFHAVDVRGTRPLAAEDDEALERLAMACDRDEWVHSGIERALAPIFGCYTGDELAAAGMLLPWGLRQCNVGIITHPSFRGQGYGRAVVSAVTAYMLAEGYVAQYQTLLDNTSSVAIARALGYRQYATTLAVRLHDVP
jgi:GNAT superfamily N-acetyltransferase